MIPSPAEVVRFRALAAAGLRLGGLVCLALAGRAALVWLVEAGIERGFTKLTFRLGDVVDTLYFGLAGCILALGAARWSRWLLPMPNSLACPACGYAIPALTAPVCPECGLALPPEFRGKPAHQGPPSDSAWLARWRMAAVLPLRLVAVWLVFTMLPASLQLYVFEERNRGPGSLVQLISYGVGLALWIFAPALVSLCIHPRLWNRLAS